jgi:predicted ribosomally synthesized peptide with SipW-like signal peptide
MKTVLMSLMVVALVGGLVGGGLFAAFSDTETSEGNTFTAGTMDLKVNGVDDPVPPVVTGADCLAPGDSVVTTVEVENVGCVDGIADIHFTVTDDADNGQEEPEAPVDPDGNLTGELCENLVMSITYNGTPIDLSSLDVGGIAGTTMDELDCNNIILGPLAAGTTGVIVITASVPAGTGNEIMGDSETVSIEFSLDQGP